MQLNLGHIDDRMQAWLESEIALALYQRKPTRGRGTFVREVLHGDRRTVLSVLLELCAVARDYTEIEAHIVPDDSKAAREALWQVVLYAVRTKRIRQHDDVYITDSKYLGAR